MAALPQFRQRMLARRTGGDIDRLTRQFKVGMNSLADEYQRAFSTYQAGVDEKMAPFQAALDKFKATDMPAYEEERAKYQRQLDAYNESLKAIEADPVVARTEREFVGRTWYGKKKFEDVTYYDPKPIPKFEAVKPQAPATPVAPEIGQFDDSQFQARRQQLSTDMSRELGERRAAKLSAVTRRGSRPMLQGN